MWINYIDSKRKAMIAKTLACTDILRSTTRRVYYYSVNTTVTILHVCTNVLDRRKIYFYNKRNIFCFYNVIKFYARIIEINCMNFNV